MEAPRDGDDWIGLGGNELPVDLALSWAVRPGCGAVVLFTGTVRDHAEGRDGVEHLEYEAYEAPAVERLRAVAAGARARWPVLGRVVLLHRVGRLGVGEVSVVVVVSAPHRPEAFEASRFCIDAVKSTVPLWKRESWRDGAGWGLHAADLAELGGG